MESKGLWMNHRSEHRLGNRLKYLCNNGERDTHTRFAVVLLFFLSAIIHGLILQGPHLVTTYDDELLYWGLAKTFWNESAFTLYQMPLRFSKFVYAMVLSPLYLIKDPIIRSELAIWLNAFIISFSVFPAYRLAKKISSSLKVQFASLVLFVCSPIMFYSKLYAPETLFLPLSLYLILGYFTQYQLICNLNVYSLRRLSIRAVLLGIYLYITYLEKETAIAFFGAFLIVCCAGMIKSLKHRDKSWQRYLLAALVHSGAAISCHVLIKLLLGVQFSYADQLVLNNLDSMYKIEFLLHCVLSNGLYICVALFGLPVLFGQLKMNNRNKLKKKDVVHDRWVAFLFTALILVLLFHSFSVSLKEELGNAKMRLHTRYYIPFLMPLLAMVLEQIRRSIKQDRKANIAGVLIVGIACILLLSPNRYIAAYDSYDTWHIQDANALSNSIAEKINGEENNPSWVTSLRLFFADQTDGSRIISYNHGLLLSMSVFVAFMVLVILLTRKYRKAAFSMLCIIVLAVEGYNNAVTLEHIGQFGRISKEEAMAYSQLDRAIKERVGNENLLVLSTSKLEAMKRKADTFFSFDWYSVLTSDFSKALGENGVVDLNNAQLPVSIPQFSIRRVYPKGTVFPYILCSKDVRFNENCVEQLLFSEKTGYYLYRVIDPAILDVDYIKDYYEEKTL